ncbi:hypothetical protein DL769_002979 [Monosporascus sp. CRB-8-3]|nr:hypothetical protein DL769_002979 [Monosporascus sp. CRB-8-3]
MLRVCRLGEPSKAGSSSSATLTPIAICDVQDFPDFPTAGYVATMKRKVPKDGLDSCGSNPERKAYYRRELTIVGDRNFPMLLYGTGPAQLWSVASGKEEGNVEITFRTELASVAADQVLKRCCADKDVCKGYCISEEKPEVMFVAVALGAGR